MQSMLVALIVTACGCYAAWSLSPLGLRRWIHRVVLRRVPRSTGGCGACDGCGPGSAGTRSAPQVVKVVPRR